MKWYLELSTSIVELFISYILNNAYLLINVSKCTNHSPSDIGIRESRKSHYHVVDVVSALVLGQEVRLA